jgi:hypothetical protein
MHQLRSDPWQNYAELSNSFDAAEHTRLTGPLIQSALHLADLAEMCISTCSNIPNIHPKIWCGSKFPRVGDIICAGLLCAPRKSSDSLAPPAFQRPWPHAYGVHDPTSPHVPAARWCTICVTLQQDMVVTPCLASVIWMNSLTRLTVLHDYFMMFHVK